MKPSQKIEDIMNEEGNKTGFQAIVIYLDELYEQGLLRPLPKEDKDEKV